VGVISDGGRRQGIAAHILLAAPELVQYASRMARAVTPPDTDLITTTREGLWRVAGTRVSVDSVVHAFWSGSTPEQVVQDYEGVSLDQVYGVIHWYLTHRTVADAYLRTQDREDKKLRRILKAQHSKSLATLRRRIAARARSRNQAA